MGNLRYMRIVGVALGLVVVLGVFLIAAAPASAELVGCRDSSPGGGVSGSGGWADGNFQICWTVTFDAGTSLWNYAYTFSTSMFDVGHAIIELTPGLTDITVAGGGQVEGPGDFGPHPSNPGIPGTMYSIKVNAAGPDLSFTLSTPAAPEWGDFYAKGGPPGTFAFNTGFTSPDFDPTTDPATTIEIDHIVRPDSRGREAVPEPGAALLFGIAVIGMASMRRRRLQPFAT